MNTKLLRAFTIALLAASLTPPAFAANDLPAVIKSAGFNTITTDLVIPAVPAAEDTKAAHQSTVSSAGILVVEPDNARDPLLNLINGAKHSIDVTIYSISDSQIVNALVAAQKKGVTVRVIYNYNSFALKNIFPNDAAIQQITAAGGQAKKASSNFTITHQKTITVDGTTSLIMTFNLSASYFTNSRDFGYITSNSTQVGEIERVFNADWSDTSITPSEASLVWSPVNSRSKILDIINRAQKTLIIDNEETFDKPCMSALMDAAKRGVSVRFLTAVLTAYSTTTANGGSSYNNSGGPDANAPERAVLNAAGVKAKGATSHYMHAKMILADYNTSMQRGFVGSENFSTTSLDKNRELGIILNDSATLTKLDTIFESDWTANP